MKIHKLSPIYQLIVGGCIVVVCIEIGLESPITIPIVASKDGEHLIGRRR